MAAVVFGSDEAKAVIKANKEAEAFEAMADIDWDDIAENAETENAGWTAFVKYEFMGEEYSADGEHDYDEYKAVDDAIDNLKEQIKQAIMRGKGKGKRQEDYSGFAALT